MGKQASRKISKIFLSSTYEDLIPYRDAVNEAFIRLGIVAKGMEFFGSKPDGPKEASLEVLKDCDAYVGIFAMRYGSIISGEDRSITHLEYEEAQRLKLPIYIYIINENEQPVLPKYVDTGEDAEKLRALKGLLKEKHTVAFFTTPDSLSRMVTQDFKDLTKTIKTKRSKKGELKSIKAGVINPSVFKLLGKKQIYMMYKLRNYYKNRNHLSCAPFGCCGIFGIADLCIKDICSDVEDLRSSMSGIFPDLDGTAERDYLTRPDYFSVKQFLKYNGYIMDKKYNIENLSFDIDIDAYRMDIKKLALNWDDDTVDDSVRKLLVTKHIILGPMKTPIKNEDQVQEWILGIFLPRESGEGMQSCERFEKFVINSILLNDDRIRTILYSGLEPGSMNLHYIMEINASANDIWDSLVLKIHETCEKNSIIVNTKTSLIVDHLSELKYNSILEPQLNEFQLADRRELIKTIERGMTKIDLENLNLIPTLKQLGAVRQDQVIKFHKNVSSFIRELQRFSPYVPELVKFLAGMILVDKLENKEILDRYYSYLYLKLVAMTEVELRILLIEKIQQKTNKSANPRNDLADLLKSLDIKLQNLSIISLGECILGIINWNELFQDDFIVSKNFSDNLKELQRNNVVAIRNMFAHCDYANNEKYVDPKKVEVSLIATINFIKENDGSFLKSF